MIYGKMTKCGLAIVLTGISLVLPLLFAQTGEAAGSFRIALMQSQRNTAAKFKPLEAYLKSHGIETEFVLAESYPVAARMFAERKVDGMFSGSAVAGAMIIKKLAFPILRPVSRTGTSQYWAVILAPRGAPQFTPTAEYFRGKRVAGCALAASGEFFLRFIPGAMESVRDFRLTESHEEAIEALARGDADIAIVKNLVWENLQIQYPKLEMVGSDPLKNPNDTLIVSYQTDPVLVGQISRALMQLAGDSSPEARMAREGLNIQGYVPTSLSDFDHTLQLLRNAGIGPDFNFDETPFHLHDDSHLSSPGVGKSGEYSANLYP